MKLTKRDKELVKKAFNLWKTKYVSKRHSIASIALTKKDDYIEGMSMEFDCSVGVCAERTALFKMMPDETEVKTIVAVYKDKVIPPCGACRELIYEMNEKNLNNTWIIISKNKKIKLKDLFPYDWKKAF